MGLSSTVLWHQTKSDAFFKILRSKKLYYSYSQEYVLTGDSEKSIAFPMISLCDLPLSEFASNDWTYGDFAIGFSQEWGLSKGFNPVCYCNKNSIFLNKIFGCLEEKSQLKIQNQILYCCAYLKYVQGPLKTSKKTYKNYKFYDEREERLILSPEENTDIKFMLLGEEYNKYKTENKNSSLVNDKFVEFNNEDICYIVVNSSANILKAKNILLKNDGCIDNIVFLTKKQIIEDVIGSNHNEENISFEDKDIEKLLDMIIETASQIRKETR